MIQSHQLRSDVTMRQTLMQYAILSTLLFAM
jgi:hypothetical protein